jgi:hypothetical protein
MSSSVDRIEVHRRFPCRHLRSELGVPFDRLCRDLLYEVGSPVPLVAGRVDVVEGGLQRGVRHRLDSVEEEVGL